MTNGVQRNLRLEGRATYAKAGAPSFQLGGTNLTTPTLAVGDTYGAITSLAVGSYTSPGTNALSVTGNVSMPGYMFCAGVIGSTGTKYNPTGQVAFTVARLSGYAAGVWTITFATPHPLGANYIVNVSGRGVYAFVAGSPTPTAAAFSVVMVATGTSTAVDGVFSFMVLAS